MKKLTRDDFIALKIEPETIGISIHLDEKKLHHVANYRIEKGTVPGTAKLILEMLVKYP